MTTRAVGATELARQWGRVMDAVRKGDHVLVMNHARPQVVIVPADWYDWMTKAVEGAHTDLFWNGAEMASRPEAPIDGFGSTEEGGTREQPHRTNEEE